MLPGYALNAGQAGGAPPQGQDQQAGAQPQAAPGAQPNGAAAPAAQAANQARLQQIDDLMTSIASRPGSGDATGVAVLACLHLADKLRAAEKKLKSFEDKSERIALMLEEALQ